MKKNKIVMVLLAMMLALMFTSVVSANVNGLSNDSLNSEIDSILNSGKNVFMFFHADGCHFCQQQKPIIDELQQEYAENITFFHVDCEEHPEAMREFGVNVYPTIILIMGKGEDGQYESQYFRGFTDKETLKKSIYRIIANDSINENSMRLPLRLSVFSPTLLKGAISVPIFDIDKCDPSRGIKDNPDCTPKNKYYCTTFSNKLMRAEASCRDPTWGTSLVSTSGMCVWGGLFGGSFMEDCDAQDLCQCFGDWAVYKDVDCVGPTPFGRPFFSNNGPQGACKVVQETKVNCNTDFRQPFIFHKETTILASKHIGQ